MLSHILFIVFSLAVSVIAAPLPVGTADAAPNLSVRLSETVDASNDFEDLNIRDGIVVPDPLIPTGDDEEDYGGGIIIVTPP